MELFKTSGILDEAVVTRGSQFQPVFKKDLEQRELVDLLAFLQSRNKKLKIVRMKHKIVSHSYSYILPYTQPSGRIYAWRLFFFIRPRRLELSPHFIYNE